MKYILLFYSIAFFAMALVMSMESVTATTSYGIFWMLAAIWVAVLSLHYRHN